MANSDIPVNERASAPPSSILGAVRLPVSVNDLSNAPPSRILGNGTLQIIDMENTIKQISDAAPYSYRSTMGGFWKQVGSLGDHHPIWLPRPWIWHKYPDFINYRRSTEFPKGYLSWTDQSRGRTLDDFKARGAPPVPVDGQLE